MPDKLMSIQLLPLQLANQIAAGEVVERPAAVVKELVENSLDAGARHIDIDIEGGGSQLIRIRDDGTGIPKEELPLALARHATSKISSLADLQAVTTLGFRGEALASINAVSRLSITSRTVQQAQAWQIYAEGHEVTSLFRPLSHPLGTTVEVLELFYNVPARRKFLRSAKTEFSHIDEVVRRIALSHFGLSLTLTHNGKRIRCYRPVSEKVTREQRLAALCGSLFAQQARVVSGGKQSLVLQGWVAESLGARTHSELQYGYVNGRVIRDKLMIHAVRQAYQHQSAPQHYPAFVLFLTMDPQEVDVNVHPTKQEVRFQQARLIHDFIYQSVLTAITEQAPHPCTPEPPGTVALAAVSQPADPSLTAGTLTAPAGVPAVPCPQSRRVGLPEKERAGWCTAKLVPYRALSQSDDTLKVGREAQPAIDKNSQAIRRGETETLGDQPVAARSLGRVLMIWQPHYAVLERSAGLALLSLPTARQYWQRAQLLPATEEASKHPLLFPLTLPLSLPQAAAAARYQPLLAQLALVFTLERHQLILQAVPPLLAQQALSSLLLALLDYLHPLEQAEAACIVEWLVQRLAPEQQGWRLSQAIQLLAELERSCPHLVDLPPTALLQPIDLAAALAQLEQSS